MSAAGKVESGWLSRAQLWAARRITLGHRPTDSRRDKTIKRVMVIVAFAFVFLNIRSHAYYITNEFWLQHYLNYGLTAAILSVFVMLKFGVGVKMVFYTAIYFWFANHIMWHFIEGNPSNFAIFMLMIPIAAILVFGTRKSLPHFCVFAASCVLIPIADSYLPYVPVDSANGFFANGQGLFGSAMKVPLTDLSFVYVLMFGTIVYISLFIVLQERDRARAQVDALLMNTLPREIVERLNREERSVSLAVEPELADEFPAVTVLFADIVGFTTLSADIKPGELVTILNDIFTRFDGLADEYGVEKIKTIGDAYMAVSGVPTPVPDHAPRIAGMALAMVRTIDDYCKTSGHSLEIRVGVNTGPVVAGVIGQRRFAYDLWGDTVNLASRMESHGKPSAVQISDATAEALDGAFLMEDRGEIEVKGKGLVHAWWLVGEVPKS